MAKIELGKFSTLLRRYLQLKGESEVASDLAPEISPVLALESDRPEWAFLASEKLMGSVFNATAAVGLASTAQLRNPLNSGVIAIITDVCLSTSVTPGPLQLMRVETNADLANALTPVARDTRFPQVSASALVASWGNVAPTGNQWFRSNASSNNFPIILKIPFVLTPGFAVQASTGGLLNAPLDGAWQYLEKRLDALEAQ